MCSIVFEPTQEAVFDQWFVDLILLSRSNFLIGCQSSATARVVYALQTARLAVAGVPSIAPFYDLDNAVWFSASVGDSGVATAAPKVWQAMQAGATGGWLFRLQSLRRQPFSHSRLGHSSCRWLVPLFLTVPRGGFSSLRRYSFIHRSGIGPRSGAGGGAAATGNGGEEIIG